MASLAQRGATHQQAAVFELWLARLTSAVLGALACLLTALAASGPVQPRAAEQRCSRDAARDAAGRARGRPDPGAGAAARPPLALRRQRRDGLAVPGRDAAVRHPRAGLRLRRDLVLAGVVAGLAFSTKYSFAVGLVLPLAAGAAGAGRADLTPAPRSPRGEGGGHRLPSPAQRERGSRLSGARPVLLVLAGFVLGAVLGAPELVLRPDAVVAGIVEQARLGGIRWNGQSDAPVWQLYAETLVQGLGWPALLAAAIGAAALGRRAARRAPRPCWPCRCSAWR